MIKCSFENTFRGKDFHCLILHGLCAATFHGLTEYAPISPSFTWQQENKPTATCLHMNVQYLTDYAQEQTSRNALRSTKLHEQNSNNACDDDDDDVISFEPNVLGPGVGGTLKKKAVFAQE